MKIFTASSIVVTIAYSQTSDEIAAYPDFADIMTRWGFTWESARVQTGDGKWDLPLFHITGTITDGPFAWSTEGPDNEKVLFMHGAG